ncbi:FHA domain-containing protein [Devriesea agamarum]|uniref:FHA domain-containing protein n=1 Tax=Devriesea agamarum TaxID=472569 RepID=UPI00071E06C8|nr:FHA domain-containing protein [Devriesea agamarum]
MAGENRAHAAPLNDRGLFYEPGPCTLIHRNRQFALLVPGIRAQVIAGVWEALDKVPDPDDVLEHIVAHTDYESVKTLGPILYGRYIGECSVMIVHADTAVAVYSRASHALLCGSATAKAEPVRTEDTVRIAWGDLPEEGNAGVLRLVEGMARVRGFVLTCCDLQSLSGQERTRLVAAVHDHGRSISAPQSPEVSAPEPSSGAPPDDLASEASLALITNQDSSLAASHNVHLTSTPTSSVPQSGVLDQLLNPGSVRSEFKLRSVVEPARPELGLLPLEGPPRLNLRQGHASGHRGRHAQRSMPVGELDEMDISAASTSNPVSGHSPERLPTQHAVEEIGPDRGDTPANTSIDCTASYHDASHRASPSHRATVCTMSGSSPLRAPEKDGHTVLGLACSGQHINPPDIRRCRVCGEHLNTTASKMPRPRLGTVEISDGTVVELDRTVIIGRKPRAPSDAAGEVPRIVTVPSPSHDISRNHLEIRLEGWNVIGRDMGSMNGTVITRPGQPPMRLRAHDGVLLRSGDVIEIGDGLTLRLKDVP